MALILALSKGALSETGGTLDLDDATETYNAETNPTGYGSPNDERTDIALQLTAITKRSSEDLSLSVSAYDPETVSRFTLNLQKDGWIQATVYGLNLSASATSGQEFSVNELVWNTSGDKRERVTAVSAIGGGFYSYTFVDSTDESDLSNDGYTTKYKTVFDTYATPDIDQAYYKASKNYHVSQDDADNEILDQIFTQKEVIRLQFANDNNSVAQEIVEDTEQFVTCLEDTEC